MLGRMFLVRFLIIALSKKEMLLSMEYGIGGCYPAGFADGKVVKLWLHRIDVGINPLGPHVKLGPTLYR